jgi:NIPSNAP
MPGFGIMPPGSCTDTAFRFLAMWETRFGERTEFVYLLQWPDEKTKTAAWSDFMQDKEWAEIKRVTSAEHGPLVGEIEDRSLTLTDYSGAAFPVPGEHTTRTRTAVN